MNDTLASEKELARKEVLILQGRINYLEGDLKVANDQLIDAHKPGFSHYKARAEAAEDRVRRAEAEISRQREEFCSFSPDARGEMAGGGPEVPSRRADR